MPVRSLRPRRWHHHARALLCLLCQCMSLCCWPIVEEVLGTHRGTAEWEQWVIIRDAVEEAMMFATNQRIELFNSS